MLKRTLLLFLILNVVSCTTLCRLCAPREADTVQATNQPATRAVTEVALYGLVSWTAERSGETGWSRLLGLMPATTGQPQCLGGGDPPERHHPVLKVVTGNPSWEGGEALPLFDGSDPRVFSLVDQEVTFDEGDVSPLQLIGFDLLSTDGSLNATTDLSINQAVQLDPVLTGNLPSGDPRLGARVVFTRGRAVAAQSRHCPDEPNIYLSRPNVSGQACPIDKPIPRKTLAEEMTVRMGRVAARLTVHFRDWSEECSPCLRTLHVDPDGTQDVRIELSHQIATAASRRDTRQSCASASDLRDYFWYYDLRLPGECPAALLRPCYAGANLGGTKCPENFWGPF